MKTKLSTLGIVLILWSSILGACGPAVAEPTPVPTATPQAEDMPLPDPARARDAVLEFVANAYTAGDFSDTVWAEDDVTAEGLVGASDRLYSAGDWAVGVSFPIVAPEATIYQVVIANEATGFQWDGEVDAYGQVTERAVQQGKPSPPLEVSAEDLVKLIQGNNAFGFDLYQALRARDGNLFYSPHSISLALAMTYAGARDETEAQMAQALSFELPQGILHPAFDALARELASRGEGAEGKDGEGFRLNIVNALWGQEGYAFLPEFLGLLDANYGAGMRLVDYVNAAEEARAIINDWVSEQTEGRIEDLIAPGVLDALTRLVLTNAIYFNAAWAEPFEDNMTQDGVFHLLDGDEVTVPMMRQTTSYAYVEGQGFLAVELPYDSWELGMVILLPEEGGFEVSWPKNAIHAWIICFGATNPCGQSL